MSIESTYSNFLIEKYIKNKLKQGDSFSALDLFEEADAIVKAAEESSKPLSKPQFDLSGSGVIDGEEASASKINTTFKEIVEDLNIAFSQLEILSQNSLDMYERWSIESDKIEKELINMEEEVENLLLLTQDTEGYHSVLVDNFTNVQSMDMSKTTADIDIDTSSISLKKSISTFTRIPLEETLELEDISFRIRSNVILSSELSGSSMLNIFTPKNIVWHTIIRTEKIKPVVCELIVKMGNEEVEVNSIKLLLHDSGHSSPMNVTVLYSTDDITYSQLPNENYSQNLTRGGNFYFSKISVKYFKFILSKNSPDRSEPDRFNYQFGFKNISFFANSFAINTSQKFESNWLYAEDEDKKIIEFEKATLETCENIPVDSKINYFLAATKTLPNAAPNWRAVTPLNRIKNGDYNPEINIFEVGRTLEQEIEDISRYTDDNAFYKYIDSATLLMSEGGVLTDEDQLYSYTNIVDDVILNCLFYNEDLSSKNKVDFNESSFILFRGVNDWEFSDPYTHYECVVEILNEKTSVNLGDSKVFIDEEENSGEITIKKGLHKIKVSKVDFNNVKSLIEDSVDFFAAIQMERVGIFDMLNNVKSTNYKKFAIDLTLPGKTSSGLDKTVKKAFLVKKNSDADEKFKIKFNLINELMKYIKIKGELETENSDVTPSCDAFQIKLG